MILNCLINRFIEVFNLCSGGCFASPASVSLLADLRRCLPCWGSCRPNDATKTDVAHSGIDHLRLARRGPVTQAVVGSAQVRTTLNDSARNSNIWLPRIVALVRRGDARIDGRAATCLDDFVRVVLDIPV